MASLLQTQPSVHVKHSFSCLSKIEVKHQIVSAILSLLALGEQAGKGMQGRWTSARDFESEG